MTGCRIHLLGCFSITISGEELVQLIPGGKAKLLLAYLVLPPNMPQNRKKIAFDFWPDSTDKQALTNLRKLLHELRKSVPQIIAYLKITPTTIQWNRELPFFLDVHELEKYANGATVRELRRAEELYKGELLPGFYEDWLHEKREQLAQAYANVLEKLITDLENEREYTSAIYFTNKLLPQNTIKEETYRKLMRLHALNQNTAGVVQIYKQLCNVLQSELGIEPAEETLQLFSRLMQNGSEKGTEKISPTPLIGRKAEWQAVRVLGIK